MDAPGNEFKDRIRALRIRRGLSQARLGKALGISSTNIFRWEKGYQKPQADLLVKIAVYFGVTVDYLLGTPIGEKGLPPGLMELYSLHLDGHATTMEILQGFIRWFAIEYDKLKSRWEDKISDLWRLPLPNISDEEVDGIFGLFNMEISPTEPEEENAVFKRRKKLLAQLLSKYLTESEDKDGVLGPQAR